MQRMRLTNDRNDLSVVFSGQPSVVFLDISKIGVKGLRLPPSSPCTKGVQSGSTST